MSTASGKPSGHLLENSKLYVVLTTTDFDLIDASLPLLDIVSLSLLSSTWQRASRPLEFVFVSLAT